MHTSRSALFAIVLLGSTPDGRTPGEEPNPANERRSTRGVLSESRAARVKQLAKRIPPDLSHKLSVEFVDLPVRDAFAFLDAAFKVQTVLASGRFQKQTLNFTLETQRLDEAFDLVCKQLDLEWETDGHVVFAGPRPAVEEFRHVLSARDERRKAYPAAVAAALQETVDVEFSNTPLEQLIRRVAKQTDVTMQVIGEPARKQRRVTFEVSGIPADVTLDLISLQYGLTWAVTAAGTVYLRDVPKSL